MSVNISNKLIDISYFNRFVTILPATDSIIICFASRTQMVGYIFLHDKLHLRLDAMSKF